MKVRELAAWLSSKPPDAEVELIDDFNDVFDDLHLEKRPDRHDGEMAFRVREPVVVREVEK